MSSGNEYASVTICNWCGKEFHTDCGCAASEEHYKKAREKTKSIGRKNDSGKPPLALIPAVAEEAEAMAFADGKRKYGQWNFMQGLEAMQLASAVRRHLASWISGEQCAQDSGVHHLGHARAGLAMIMALEASGKLIDDRPPTAKIKELECVDKEIEKYLTKQAECALVLKGRNG